jgi:hypothetical protein
MTALGFGRLFLRRFDVKGKEVAGSTYKDEPMAMLKPALRNSAFAIVSAFHGSASPMSSKSAPKLCSHE